MKLILPLVAVLVIFAPILLVIGCEANREHWKQRPPTGPDTARTVDADGNPSFGPK